MELVNPKLGKFLLSSFSLSFKGILLPKYYSCSPMVQNWLDIQQRCPKSNTFSKQSDRQLQSNHTWLQLQPSWIAQSSKYSKEVGLNSQKNNLVRQLTLKGLTTQLWLWLFGVHSNNLNYSVLCKIIELYC